jgi:hypothetical protein
MHAARIALLSKNLIFFLPKKGEEKNPQKCKKTGNAFFWRHICSSARNLSSMLSKPLCLLFSLLFSSVLFSQTLVNDKVDVQEGPGEAYRNAVLYFPANYSEDKKYPLVIFTHGMGEAGNDVNKLYRTGLPRVLKSGYRPSFDFIMVAPQHGSFSALTNWLPGILEDANKRWNIDENRVYLTGLSAGGRSLYGSQLSISPALASKFAAIVINAGVTPAAAQTNFDFWKIGKTPLWAVVGDRDKSYVAKNKQMVKEVNKIKPGLAKLTLQKGVGHTGWDNVYNGKVKNGNKTMWEWMYQFKRGTSDFPQLDGNGNDSNDDNGGDGNDDDGDGEDNDDNGDDDGNNPPTSKTVKVNVFTGNFPYNNNQWNNWNVGTGSKKDIQSSAFTYTDLTVSTITATLSSSYATVDNGSNYGQGMAPAQVLRHTSYDTKERTLTISGLTPNKKYDFDFYASRNRKNNYTTFTIANGFKKVNTYFNLANIAAFKKVKANANGEVVVTIKNVYLYNYLNGFTISESTGGDDSDDDGEEDNDDEDEDDGDDDGDN